MSPEILLDCARQFHRLDDGFSFDQFCEALGAPTDEARPVLDMLVQDGFIAIGAADVLQPTRKLSQLANSTVSNGLPRSEADRLLQRVVARAAEINASPAAVGARVLRLAIFGSYLGESVLGDLDIASPASRSNSTIWPCATATSRRRPVTSSAQGLASN